MTTGEAAALGAVQGLGEFLPISSSGHLEIGKAALGMSGGEGDLTFSVVVHVATTLATVLVFRRDISRLFGALFRRGWDDEKQFILLLLVSAVPAGVVGLLFKDELEGLFNGNLLLVGSMLWVTAALLLFTRFGPKPQLPVNMPRAVGMGLAQAVAILPGISRSGATISAGLLMGVERSQAARFSFLMSILPILGAGLLEVKELAELPAGTPMPDALPLAVGFVVAFGVGLVACTWMLRLVKHGQLHWFAAYCALAGAVAVGVGSGLV